MGAVGAFIDGAPLVCGGLFGGKGCHGYDFFTQSWTKAPFLMLRHRQEAAGMTFPNGSWLVIGGRSIADTAMADSELLVDREGDQKGINWEVTNSQ